MRIKLNELEGLPIKHLTYVVSYRNMVDGKYYFATDTDDLLSACELADEIGGVVVY
jgi:hypothetical protein